MLSSAILPEEFEGSRLLAVLTVVLFILLLCSMVTMVRLYVQCRRANSQLASALDTLESSRESCDNGIGNVLDVCSRMLNKFHEQNRLARRKINAGKADELHAMIKNDKFFEEHVKVFNEFFDSSFLDLYPDFVSDVNRLMRDDQQLPLPVDSRLSTEVRILALYRLGFSDAAEVSKLTGVSLNTIYTYRNKSRGRAIDRATFDAGLLEIGR